MSKASVKVAALVATGLLALSGCVSGNPQVAAYVGPDRITQAQVESVAQVLSDTSSSPVDTMAAFTPTVMSIMVQNKLTSRAAEANGLTVSETDRQAFFASDELYSVLLKNPASAGFMSDFANTAVLLSTDAGQAAVQETIRTTTVRVNPRFGEWDPEVGLVPGSSGSLSEPASIKQE